MRCPQCGYDLDDHEIDEKDPLCPHCGEDLTPLLKYMGPLIKKVK
jgi:ribosomal protein S27AE